MALALTTAFASAQAGAAKVDEREDAGSSWSTLPARLTVGGERWTLPGDEKLGAVGLSYTVELVPDWWIGPALYGAATGHRGGLFTWGIEAQRRWTLSPRWRLAAGLYAGAGGGAAAPVGGGLMIRPHLDALTTLGDWELGASLSQVHFPEGRIGSTQLGLLVTFPDSFLFGEPVRHRPSKAMGLVADRGHFHADRLALTLTHYEHGSRRQQALDAAGIRLEQQVDEHWWGTLEAAGAARGGGDGYAEMQIGTMGLWSIPGAPMNLGGRVSAGMAGGGYVPTGGGLVWRLAAMAELPLGRIDLIGQPATLAFEAGQINAVSGTWRSPYVQVSLSAGLSPSTRDSGASAHDMDWSFSSQTYAAAARKQGRARALSTLGLRFSRQLDETIHVTGQAHGAATGGAGAYSAGLVGLGMSTPLAGGSQWRLGGEAMLGVAGGGGISNGGGAIVQPMAWLEHSPSMHQRWRFGAGYLQSVRGELSTAVIELSWGLTFGRP